MMGAQPPPPLEEIKTIWILLLLSSNINASPFSESASESASAGIGKYFIKSPQSIVAPPGDRVTFGCETNIPPEQIRWKLNGVFISDDEPDVRFSSTSLLVKVSKARERYVQQIGDYQCVASFGAEALTSLPASLSIAALSPFPPTTGNHRAGLNRSFELVEGNDWGIQCEAPYSNPPPFIQFFKDGRPLDENLVSDSGLLHLTKVGPSDGGLYGCSVTNHITTETLQSPSFVKLVVLSARGGGGGGGGSIPRSSPTFLIKPKQYLVVPLGGNVSLDCIAVGNPPPTISWRKLRSPTNSLSPSTSGSTLQLTSVSMETEGEYVCEAWNGVGETLTSLSTVVLNSPPRIRGGGEHALTVEEGAGVSLPCAASGLPKPRSYWLLNGVNLREDGNLRIVEGTGLSIAAVERKHAGLWQCFATNPMGSASHPVELRVLPKQSVAMLGGQGQLKGGRHAHPASAYPPTSILKEDLEAQIKFPQQQQQQHLHHHHHKGGKGAAGGGGVGSTQGSMGSNKRRKVKGQEMTPPSKPVMNRLSEDSVMVRWSVPPNSGYPIQFFKVQYKEVRKGSRWSTIDEDIPPHIHSYEVKELRQGHSYKFRIAAVYSNNDNKVGPNSDKFYMGKGGGGGGGGVGGDGKRPLYPPVITNALQHNDTSILLKWKLMKGEAAGLDGYFIYYRESTSASEYSKLTVLGAHSESAYISFLKTGVSYDIKIQSFNTNGASGFSSIVAQKTTGQASTEKPEEGEKEKELIVPEDDEVIQGHDQLYVLLGSLFLAFWVVVCVSCALCYKCKQRRVEEDAKTGGGGGGGSGTVDGKNDFLVNSHLPYISTITSHLEEKETSFSFNNNELSSFKSTTTTAPSTLDTELQIMSSLRKDSLVDVRNCNSLHRKKNQINHNHHHHAHHAHSTSLRKLPYVSCSSEDVLELDDEGGGGSRIIFPKEQHRLSRKHNRRKLFEGERNS